VLTEDELIRIQFRTRAETVTGDDDDDADDAGGDGQAESPDATIEFGAFVMAPFDKTRQLEDTACSIGVVGGDGKLRQDGGDQQFFPPAISTAAPKVTPIKAKEHMFGDVKVGQSGQPRQLFSTSPEMMPCRVEPGNDSDDWPNLVYYQDKGGPKGEKEPEKPPKATVVVWDLDNRDQKGLPPKALRAKCVKIYVEMRDALRGHLGLGNKSCKQESMDPEELAVREAAADNAVFVLVILVDSKSIWRLNEPIDSYESTCAR